jgi:hypothetical protein
MENYALTFNQREYISLRVVWVPSTPSNVNDPQNEVFIDDVVVSGPFVPKTKETPGLNLANFGGPDWPPLTIAVNAPTGSGWYESGDRFEIDVNVLKGVYPPEFQWLRSETAEGTPVEIPGATNAAYVDEALALDESGWYSCRITSSQSKTELLTDPIHVLVVPTGSLPAVGIAALCIAAVTCVLMGVVGLRRRLAARKARP